jgi:MFS transporter, Spinster family, sphingosine-1-phosphate transporter
MSENPSPHYKWVVVAVMWLIACLNYTDRMAIFSVLPVLKQEMGFTDIALSLLGSTFLWVYGICSPVGGYLGDRFSRRRVILVSLVLFSMITFATGLTRTPGQMIGLRCLLGVSEAIFLPPALAYIASFHTDRTRSLANSIALTGLTTGAGFGSWYGGYMSEHYSWRVGFFLLGIIGIVVAVLAAILLRRDHVVTLEEGFAPEPFWRKMVAVVQTPTARALIFLAFALSLTSWPTHSWIPTYLYEKFSLTLTHAGSTITWYAALPALLGGIFGGVLADLWSARDGRGRMAVQVIGFAVMAPAMLAIGFMPSARGIAIDLVIYSLFRGMLECNSMPIFCAVVPPHRWSMAYGIYNLAGTLAGSLGILFVGMQKSTWGIGFSLSAMSSLLFFALIVMAITTVRYLKPDIRRQRELVVSTEIASPV